MKIGTIAIETPIGTVERVGVHTAQGIVDATAAQISWLERTVPTEPAQRIGTTQTSPTLVESSPLVHRPRSGFANLSRAYFAEARIGRRAG
jgi:hypothetical protein